MAEHTNSHFEPWRLQFVIFGLLGVFLIFVGRLVGLQVVNGEEYVEAADENRTSTVTVFTERGVIYDRNGFVLARNIPSYNVTIIPAEMPDDDGDIEEIYRELSELIDWPVTDLELTDETARLFTPCATEFGIREIVELGWSIAPYDPVRIVCDVEREIAMTIEEKQHDWPGVGVEVVPIRDYPTGWLTSEVIGFLGPIPATLEDYYVDLGFVPNVDKVGYAGVESSLDDVLRGSNGLRTVEVNALGQVIRDLEDPIEPEPGLNVKLTIDTRLQTIAKEALLSEIEFWNNYSGTTLSSNGVVIAMNPKTGEVLAMVSHPTIENNRMARFIPADYYQQVSEDPWKPLINHAISAEHPPGSVYKIPASLGALNEEVVDLYEEIFCPPSLIIMQKFSPNDPGTPQEFVDWKDEGHGLVDWHHAIAYSADVYYYQISGGYQDVVEDGLGIWRMAEYSRAIGYGEPTGIELPGEEDGLVPDPDWKRINQGESWATGDTYIASMGQGFVLATPLQVAAAYSVIANDGKYMQPTIVYEYLDSEGNVVKPFEPQLKWDVTVDPVITVFDEFSYDTGEKRTIEPYVIEEAQVGLRLTVTDPDGTAYELMEGSDILSSGKTGTAEYCDEVAQEKNLCSPGNWPAHAWYAGYAPYDDPEIVVVAFVYNGTEGSRVAGPIVRQVLEAYFELKKIDNPSEN